MRKNTESFTTHTEYRATAGHTAGTWSPAARAHPSGPPGLPGRRGLPRPSWSTTFERGLTVCVEDFS